MIHKEIGIDQLDRARRLYNFTALPGSIMKGKSNLYGAIGEIIILDQYAPDDEYIGDEICDIKINGQLVDVKSKKTTVEPKPHYFASVADPNRKQDFTKYLKCDWLCFTRVHENLLDAWILGWMTTEEFFRRSIYYKKGEIDPSSDRGWTFRENCWNLAISELGVR